MVEIRGIVPSPFKNNHLGCFFTAFDSPFLYLRKNIEPRFWRGSIFLVEMRGIEPLSENLLIQLSPSAFRLLEFPLTHGGGQPYVAGSHFMRDALNGERRVHVHRSNDAQSEVAILLGGTGGIIMPRHCP